MHLKPWYLFLRALMAFKFGFGYLGEPCFLSPSKNVQGILTEVLGKGPSLFQNVTYESTSHETHSGIFLARVCLSF